MERLTVAVEALRLVARFAGMAPVTEAGAPVHPDNLARHQAAVNVLLDDVAETLRKQQGHAAWALHLLIDELDLDPPR